MKGNWEERNESKQNRTKSRPKKKEKNRVIIIFFMIVLLMTIILVISVIVIIRHNITDFIIILILISLPTWSSLLSFVFVRFCILVKTENKYFVTVKKPKIYILYHCEEKRKQILYHKKSEYKEWSIIKDYFQLI